MLKIDMPDIHVSKEKLPRGHSYPMQTSMLDEALRNADLAIETHIDFSRSKRFFDASFRPADARVSNDHLYLYIGTVPSEHRLEARHYVSVVVIPEIVSWLNVLMNAPANSTLWLEQQERWWAFKPGWQDSIR
jgi:hypothetical protein